MVRQEPVLWWLFDEVSEVIAKIQLNTIQDIENKAISGLIARIANAPGGIRYNA